MPQAIRIFISHIWAEGEHDFAMELATKLTGYRDLAEKIAEVSTYLQGRELV